MERDAVQIGYVHSKKQALLSKSAGKNYYDAYWEEILTELGVSAACYESVSELCRHLQNHSLVILGELPVSAGENEALRQFVNNGGFLIGSLTEGTDGLFGVETQGMHFEADDEYTIQAYAAWNEAGKPDLPADVPPGITLPVISKYRECTLNGDTASLLYFLPPTSFAIGGGTDSGIPGLTARKLGGGTAYYFTFSLPQTLCCLHQGRPVDRDWDGDGFYRTGDAITLTQCHDLSVPYGDLYLSILRDIMDRAGIPSVWQLPPTEEGAITELVIHFGGDDEYDRTNVQIPAAERMHALGLPYHLNLLPGQKYGSGEEFAVSREQYAALNALGCERSIHFDFFRPRTFFTEEDVYEQLDNYEKVFGETPVCSVNHVLMWSGWSDFPRWCEKRGLKGDASRTHVFLVPDANPINQFGLAFGTAFPHFVMDDWRYENRMLDYCYLPIMLYEPRVTAEHEEEDRQKLRALLDRSKSEGWLLNFFIHPVYVARSEDCVRAIEFTVDYLKKEGCIVRYFGTDETCLWWHARKSSTVSGSAGVYTLNAPYRDGAIIRFPETIGERCTVDGKPAKLTKRTIAGKNCGLLAVAQGVHHIVF